MSASLSLASVIVVAGSQNSKLSTNKGVAVTLVSQASCPKYCAFFGPKGGCYANKGLSAIHTSRLNRNQKKGRHTRKQMAEEEAAGIRNLPGTKPLRCHVVGDWPTRESLAIVIPAIEEYAAKNGMPVWSYTHVRGIARKHYGTVLSIFSSCQSVEEAKKEMARGFAAAIVWPEKFASKKAIPLGDGVTGIPCPVQVKTKESCATCGLCMRSEELLKKKIAILFEPDRGTAADVKSSLAKFSAKFTPSDMQA